MKKLALALFVSLLLPVALAAGQQEGSTQAQIDINNATTTELMTLPGIGPSRAAAIVRQRERRPFKKVRDIMRIRGIGRKTFRKLREHLTVSPVPAAGSKNVTSIKQRK